ncbi:4135_t:CDS:2, partial [Gigaspora rosea]
VKSTSPLTTVNTMGCNTKIYFMGRGTTIIMDRPQGIELKIKILANETPREISELPMSKMRKSSRRFRPRAVCEKNERTLEEILEEV